MIKGFMHFVLLILLSISISVSYANTAVTSATGFDSLSGAISYKTISSSSLNSKLLSGSGQLTIVDIRDKALFENGHVTGAKSVDANLLSDLITTGGLDIAKPLVIVGNDATFTDFFGKLASFYGYEVYVLEGGFEKWVNSGYDVALGLEEYSKSVNQLDAQPLIDTVRRAIDVSTTALANLSQNLGNVAGNDPGAMNLITDVLGNITSQINRLRENPVVAMFLPTDDSLGDVLLDIFRDDRGIRNDAHAEGVTDAMNLVGMGPSRHEARRMGRSDRFARRQVIGAANDLKAEGFSEGVADALRLQGIDISRRQARRMGRSDRYARRQVIGAADDLKSEGFNEGVADTLALLGVKPSRRQARRMGRSSRNQIDAINDAKNQIVSQGYDKGYQAGYNDGYNQGLTTGLTRSGLSGFRVNRLERKQHRVLFKNINPRDNILERRINKIEERVGSRKFRRFNRQERHDEFRDYGIIQKGRTIMDLAVNTPLVSDAVWGLPALVLSSLASLVSFIPYVGGVLSLITPVVRIGVGTGVTVLKGGLNLLGDDSYRTEMQRDFRVTRNLRNDLRRTNRQDRVVGAVPFPRINPVDNIIERVYTATDNHPVRQLIRNTRLNLARSEARRTRLEQKFEERDALDDVTIFGDRIRDFTDNWYVNLPVHTGGNLLISGVSGLAGLALGTVLPAIGGPMASIAGSVVSYLWDIAYGTVADDYAARANPVTRRENRQNRNQVRQLRRAERQFGAENVQPNLRDRLGFGSENVRGGILPSLQFGASGTPISNAIEIIRTITAPMREERQQNRRERRENNRTERRQNRTERQGRLTGNVSDGFLRVINIIRNAYDLAPISKDESAMLIDYLQTQETN